MREGIWPNSTRDRRIYPGMIDLAESADFPTVDVEEGAPVAVDSRPPTARFQFPVIDANVVPDLINGVLVVGSTISDLVSTFTESSGDTLTAVAEGAGEIIGGLFGGI
jgi:hypothetical protein